MSISDTIQSIRDNGSENYFALATLNNDELLNALQGGKHSDEEHAAILEEIRIRMA